MGPKCASSRQRGMRALVKPKTYTVDKQNIFLNLEFRVDTCTMIQ